MNPNLLEQIRSELRAWSDGPKHLFVHSSKHMPIIHLAQQENVEVLVSTPVLTVTALEKAKVGKFIVVFDGDDEDVHALVEGLNYPGLDLRIFVS